MIMQLGGLLAPCTPSVVATRYQPSAAHDPDAPHHHHSPQPPPVPSLRRAILHNLRYDETVVTFHNASGLGTAVGSSRAGSEPSTSRSSAVTAISFRTGAGVPLMAAGGTAGVVTVWNLEERRLATIVKDAHDAPLVALHFFAGAVRAAAACLPLPDAAAATA